MQSGHPVRHTIFLTVGAGRQETLHGHCMKIVSAILLISISTHSAAIDLLKSIPAEFQGKWSHRIEECSLHPLTKDTFPSLMTITEHGISYYESIGKAATIVRRNKQEIAMILEFSGGGDFWLAYKHYVMSADRKTISDESNPQRKKTIYRCMNNENDA